MMQRMLRWTPKDRRKLLRSVLVKSVGMALLPQPQYFVQRRGTGTQSQNGWEGQPPARSHYQGRTGECVELS